MHDPLGLLIFIVILVISIVGKLKRKSEDEPQRPTTEIPDLDIPDILKRMFRGEAGVPTARPARPKEVDDDDEGWQPVPPVVLQAPPRRESTYQPPVARPAVQPVPNTEGPARPRPPIVVKAPVPGPPARPAPQPAPRPSAPVRQPVPRPAAPARQPAPAPSLMRSQTLTVKSLRAPIAPKPRTPAKKPPQTAAAAQPRSSRAILSNLDDVRRGIILSEVLGPPVSMR